MKHKAILNLMSAMALMIGTSVQAATICESNQTGVEWETYRLKIDGDTYEVSHWGHSRNTYHATYKSAQPQFLRFGTVSELSKFQDFSTWQDMPETLTLALYDHSDRKFLLPGLDTGALVVFNASDCKEE